MRQNDPETMNDESTVPGNGPLTPEALHQLWLGFFYQSLGFVAVLLILVNTAEFGGYRPEWGAYALGLGLLSALPAIVLLTRYRSLLRDTPPSRRREPGHLRRLRQSMVLGIALADLPAMMGFIHYVVAAQIMTMIALCLATSLLIYLYKPSL